MKPHRLREIFRLPAGRLLWTKDQGESMRPADLFLQSHLEAVHLRDDPDFGRHIYKRYDLGSGLVTNAGVNMMANDFNWGNGATLKQMNNHGCGTGATAAALTDVFCQTPTLAASLTGSTNGWMAGTQTYVSPNIYKTVGTFTYNTGVAVTEWSLAMANALIFTRTSAGSAPTNNTFTDTGASFTVSGQGLAGYTIEIAATVINTPTSTVMGQILSNSGTVITLQGPSASAAWVTLANAVASVPGATLAYQVFPTCFDHKVFSAINVISGDSIQFTYSLTIASGG